MRQEKKITTSRYIFFVLIQTFCFCDMNKNSTESREKLHYIDQKYEKITQAQVAETPK